jgi:hypothetical protein
MALWSTQPPTEINTRNISWGGKDGRCIGLKNLPLSCDDCLEIWEPQYPGTLRAITGIALAFRQVDCPEVYLRSPHICLRRGP